MGVRRKLFKGVSKPVNVCVHRSVKIHQVSYAM